jgi:NAD(P)-dependent dehydrogenase (short-subunit alcohol dehydrogenase family)
MSNHLIVGGTKGIGLALTQKLARLAYAKPDTAPQII